MGRVIGRDLQNWTPLALKKILLEAIYGSFAEVTSQMYQVESVES